MLRPDGLGKIRTMPLHRHCGDGSLQANRAIRVAHVGTVDTIFKFPDLVIPDLFAYTALNSHSLDLLVRVDKHIQFFGSRVKIFSEPISDPIPE